MNIFVAGGLEEIMGGLQDLSKLPILYCYYTVAVLAASKLGTLDVSPVSVFRLVGSSYKHCWTSGRKNTGKW